MTPVNAFNVLRQRQNAWIPVLAQLELEEFSAQDFPILHHNHARKRD